MYDNWWRVLKMLKSEKCIYLVYCCEMMCKFQNTGVVVLARAIFLLLALLIHLLFLAKWCYFCLLKSWRRWCCLINIFCNSVCVLWHPLLVGQQEGRLACKKLSGGVLAWLYAWGEVQICICPSWCHWHSLSLAPVNLDWFYLSGTGSTR